MLAGFAAAEVDKFAETKGIPSIVIFSVLKNIILIFL